MPSASRRIRRRKHRCRGASRGCTDMAASSRFAVGACHRPPSAVWRPAATRVVPAPGGLASGGPTPRGFPGVPCSASPVSASSENRQNASVSAAARGVRRALDRPGGCVPDAEPFRAAAAARRLRLRRCPLLTNDRADAMAAAARVGRLGTSRDRARRGPLSARAGRGAGRPGTGLSERGSLRASSPPLYPASAAWSGAGRARRSGPGSQHSPALRDRRSTARVPAPSCCDVCPCVVSAVPAAVSDGRRRRAGSIGVDRVVDAPAVWRGRGSGLCRKPSTRVASCRPGAAPVVSPDLLAAMFRFRLLVSGSNSVMRCRLRVPAASFDPRSGRVGR